MSPALTLATAARVLRQLRHDPRTIGLMVTIPSLLLTLLRFIFNSQPLVFDRVGLVLLGVFPFTSMFLVTSVAMLRERTSGTLERLLTTPLNKSDLLLGYGIAFATAAAIQSLVAASVAYGLLGLNTKGSPFLIGGLAIADAILGMSIGLFTSAFASSEFEAVQFMPVVVMPQALLCGLIVPRDKMVGWLKALSDVLPLSYAVQALTEVQVRSTMSWLIWRDLGIVLAAAVISLVLAAATLGRRSA
jgi:ABC-2 type transport system permease protein